MGAVATLPASQPLPKALASKDYAAYAAERKQERERKRLEEAAQLRAKKMAAAARKCVQAFLSSAAQAAP